MGCHTRQYLQPSIPLPASTRLTSAAKHLRGASLGGPPGSLSPLTPNKSWAQIVASSTPRQKKPHHQQQQQQQQQHPSQSVLTAPSSSGISLKRQQQPPPPTAVTSGVAFNKAAAAAGVPPPQFGGGGGGKPAKNASLRAITGLGVSTSSNRDFKSLLLRLKTALEKEKEKWRPKWNAGGGSGGGGEDRNIGCHVPFSDGGDNPRDQEQHRHHSPVIGGKQRDECIFWLAWILRKFQFSAETMSLSVALFDAVLTASSSSSSPTSSSTSSSLSVTAENCKLVVLVCMQLSAKFSEEDADVPTTRDLLAVSEIGADSAAGDGGGGVVSMEAALKMERVILTALDWDLNRPTPLKFLEILHTLLMCHQPQLLEDAALGLTPVKHLQRLTWKMQRIVANHQLALCYRPAVLAVALLSLDLESIGVSDWQLVSAALEKICQIGGGGPGGEDRHQITRCKNLIVRLLAGDRKGLSAPAAATTAAGGEGERGGRANNEAEVSSETAEKKRSMTKLKRKHVPSESGGGFITDAAAASSSAAAASSTTPSAGSSSSSTTAAASSTSKTTLKRVFNIAESPTCKSEARSEEEAAASRGSLAAADRFQALQGLCINIY